jgi:hypothetical protein
MQCKCVSLIGVRLGLAVVGALTLSGTVAGFGRTSIDRLDAPCGVAMEATRSEGQIAEVPVSAREPLGLRLAVAGQVNDIPAVAGALTIALLSPAIEDGMRGDFHTVDMRGVTGRAQPPARGRRPPTSAAHPRKTGAKKPAAGAGSP